MALFCCAGTIRLHSGLVSDWKIDCDALTDDDIEALAYLAATRLPPFGHIEGIPSGGLRFAEALRPYSKGGRRLLVDDVLTTGGSMLEHYQEGDLGVVIFARGPWPAWVEPLFAVGPLLGRYS